MSVLVMCGDCRDVLAGMEAESFSAIVTDPPAGISFMNRGWDGDKGGRDAWIAWMQEIAAECLRVCRPGAHALVWALPRTSHWTAMAWENAGWTVRDRVAHLFASGFPKSLDVSKAIDRAAPRAGMFDAFAHHFAERREASGKSRRELAELFRSKTGGITGCVWNWENGANVPTREQWAMLQPLLVLSDEFLPLIERVETERESIGVSDNVLRSHRSSSCNYAVNIGSADITAPATEAARQWQGWGTALKPACEDWWLMRKPLSEGTVAANVLRWGTGALNIDAGRVACEPIRTIQGQSSRQQNGEMYSGRDQRDQQAFESHPAGRWPPNLAHDGSPEVMEAFGRFGAAGGGEAPSTHGRRETENGWAMSADGALAGRPTVQYNEAKGTAARFFFCGKATKEDRMGTTHPTTKPTELIKWLCKLVNPPGGVILDPFAGSGTLAVAATRLGMDAVLIDNDPESIAMINQRLRILEEETPLFPPDVRPAEPRQGSLLDEL